MCAGARVGAGAGAAAAGASGATLRAVDGTTAGAGEGSGAGAGFGAGVGALMRQVKICGTRGATADKECADAGAGAEPTLGGAEKTERSRRTRLRRKRIHFRRVASAACTRRAVA